MKYLLIVNFMSFVAFASTPYNAQVLETVREMPQAGGYSTGRDAFAELDRRIQLVDGEISVDNRVPGPSFCSSATYFLVLKVLEKIQNKTPEIFQTASVLKLSPRETPEKFLQDGFGIWGRWNANGPGTAALFHDLDLGDNFSDDGFYVAKPGDFLKIFWRWGEGVGKLERGHSVVFTRVVPANAKGSRVREVCFWSSHGYEDGRTSGMGEKCVPRADAKEMIFSRLLRPENLNRVLAPEFRHENKYLSSLLDTISTIDEARRETGARVVNPPRLKGRL